MSNNFENILSRLQGVKGVGYQYTALCPAHDDKNTSLSIALNRDKILVKCFVGCDAASIVAALGLKMSDLFMYRLPPRITEEAVYEYTDKDGALIYRKKRYRKDDGEKFFAFYRPNGKKGLGRTLHEPYKLHKLRDAEKIYFVEGEKCVHAVEKAGYIATTLDAGAASPWREYYTPYFEGKQVIILPDNDKAGFEYAQEIKEALPHAVIKALPDLPKKGDVYDWLEQGRTIEEINELPDFTDDFRSSVRPKKRRTKKEFSESEQKLLNEIVEKYGVYDEEKITIAGVAYHLESRGIRTKYNETTRKVNVSGLDDDDIYAVEGLPVRVYNELNLQYKKCSVGIVQDYIRFITLKNAYNPVLELIEDNAWDGVDRLPELFRIMRIADDNRLSKTLIYKWLWQNLSMLRNNRGEFGADGLLVLKGGQAAGKTTFARKMALKEEFFGESIILDVRDKDSVITAVSCWIGELGEIESTFKSDINALKGFISRAMDRFRVPYGRVDEAYPRRTSFIGTCNSDEYLIDETGNRRYWTVPIDERMDLNALAEFDVLQLYLQVDEMAKNNIQGFRLTFDELTQLAERNGRHEKPLKGELEVRDILAGIGETDSKQELTVSAFKNKFPSLNKFDVRQIGQALNKLGVKRKIKRGVVYYEFPIEALKTGWNSEGWNAEK